MGMEEEAQARCSVSVRYMYYSQKFLSLSLLDFYHIVAIDALRNDEMQVFFFACQRIYEKFHILENQIKSNEFVQ